MSNVMISIVGIVGSPLCVEAEDGQRVYELIKKAISEKKKITVSFLNVKMMTSAFLNTAIGQLYRDSSEDDIRNYLSVEDISEDDLVLLKRVVDTAKLFYSKGDEIGQSITDILGE